MVEAAVCEQCQKPAEGGGFPLPLCAGCRDTLSHRPYPGWVWASGAVILLVFLIALNRFPDTLMAGVAFAQGEKAEAAKEYPRAVAEYKKVVERFPDSTLALARLGIAHYPAGQREEAAAVFRRLRGRKASKDLVREINQAIGEMQKKSK